MSDFTFLYRGRDTSAPKSIQYLKPSSQNLDNLELILLAFSLNSSLVHQPAHSHR